MKEAFVIEHRWTGVPWLQTRPIHLFRDDAETVAKKMADEVPARSKVRTGYQARVRTVAGEVLATFPRQDGSAVKILAEGELEQKLVEIADREGRPVSAVARDALAVQLGVHTAPVEEEF